MFCGLSMEFKDFGRLPVYYTQAAYAARHARARRTQRSSAYRTVYQDHLLETLQAQGDLGCFCEPKLYDLWRNGTANDRALVSCLRVYLACGCNIAAAARRLCIHRNTLIYRLEKAERLLGVALKDCEPEQTFIYLLSCIALEGGAVR